jgi:hypothetical protein
VIVYGDKEKDATEMIDDAFSKNISTRVRWHEKG